VLRKCEEWFEELGIDWLLLGWSNMHWMKPVWEKHSGPREELEDTTNLLFKTYSEWVTGKESHRGRKTAG
jgi:hypothetical protein